MILREIKKGNIKVVLSDYLIDEALAALKKEGESFTEMIKRITSPLRKKKLSEFAGKIKDEQFAKAALEVRHHPSRFKTANR